MKMNKFFITKMLPTVVKQAMQWQKIYHIPQPKKCPDILCLCMNLP